MHVAHHYKHSPASLSNDSRVSFLCLSTSRSPPFFRRVVNRHMYKPSASVLRLERSCVGYLQEEILWIWPGAATGCARDAQPTAKVLEWLHFTESLFSEKTRNDSAARKYVRRRSGRRDARLAGRCAWFSAVKYPDRLLLFGVRQVRRLIWDSRTDQCVL